MKTPIAGSSCPLPIDLMEGMAQALRVLGHRDRLRILEHIEQNGDEPVHAITGALKLPQAVVSAHLQKMKLAGILRSERRGQESWYGILNPHSVTILNCIRQKARKS